jgi:hypothetical protein
MPASLRHLTEGERALYGYNPAGMVEAIVRKIGNGHTEATVRTVPTILEVPPNWGAPPVKLNRDTGELEPAPEETPRAQRLASSIRRSKRALRHRIKAAGFNTMLTLTYAENMGDRATALRHLKEFNRRLRRVWSSWRCVGVLERQQRGAYHWHLACMAPPPRFLLKDGSFALSYDVLRQIWEAVIGQPGRIRVGFRDGKRPRPLDPLKLVSYLGKYLGKAIGDFHQLGTRAYHWSGEAAPRALIVRRTFPAGAILDALTWVSCEVSGMMISHYVTQDGDTFTHWDAYYDPPS